MQIGVCAHKTDLQSQIMKMVAVTTVPTLDRSVLTVSEQVLACCVIARQKLETGEYEAGCTALKGWWTLGEWPRQSGLDGLASAELLLVAGTLGAWVASSSQTIGRKPSEALLNGSVAIFEQLGLKKRAAEGRIELATCYYHQGDFDLARSTLETALADLSDEDQELRGVTLLRLAVVERFSGRLQDALGLLREASPLVYGTGDWPEGRLHLETANTLKDLGSAEKSSSYFESALEHYNLAL